jgi:predicted amidophosphoribosyltransferase
MLNKIFKWLANRNFIRLRTIDNSELSYCPLCLSDVKKKPGEPVNICSTCGVKLTEHHTQHYIQGAI